MSASVDLFGADSGADFSPDGLYRYRLWRVWDPSRPILLFILINPSKANEITNDPTAERCQRRAIHLGFGGMCIVNLFGLVSTDPSVLKGHPDPVGPDNDDAILQGTREAGMVICGWGTPGKLRRRGEEVLALLRSNSIQPLCLILNADGTPGHPLYIPYAQKPIPLF